MFIAGKMNLIHSILRSSTEISHQCNPFHSPHYLNIPPLCFSTFHSNKHYCTKVHFFYNCTSSSGAGEFNIFVGHMLFSSSRLYPLPMGNGKFSLGRVALFQICAWKFSPLMCSWHSENVGSSLSLTSCFFSNKSFRILVKYMFDTLPV